MYNKDYKIWYVNQSDFKDVILLEWIFDISKEYEALNNRDIYELNIKEIKDLLITFIGRNPTSLIAICDYLSQYTDWCIKNYHKEIVNQYRDNKIIEIINELNLL